MVLRRGRPPQRAAPVDGLHPRHHAEPGPAAAPGHHQRARQGTRACRSRRSAPPAAESTGMHYYDEPPATGPKRAVSGDQERELLIASIDELSAEDRRHVAALVESLRNRPAPPSTGLTGRKSQKGCLAGRIIKQLARAGLRLAGVFL